MGRRSLHSARLVIAASLLATPLLGCATSLDKARMAYADGEGDLAAAEPLYRQAMQDPDEAQWAREELFEAYLAAAEANEKKDRPTAESYYRKALELMPQDERALTGLAKVLRDSGKIDEALVIARRGASKASAECRGCKRLIAVMLIRRGEAALGEQQWSQAEADYAEALGILPDASVALGLARARLERGNEPGAAEALQSAAPLISTADVQARKVFLDLRRQTVLAAVKDEDLSAVDNLLKVAPSGVTSEDQVALAVEVAMALGRHGQADAGLERMAALAAAQREGKLGLQGEQGAQLDQRLAALHLSRAAERIAQGDAAGAQADIAAAETVRPGDPLVAMQKVLLLAAQGNAAAADAALAQIGADAPGRSRLEGLLLAQKVEAAAARGDLAAARKLLEQAQAKAEDLPEVHVAAATVLAASPIPKLDTKAEAKLREHGPEYPAGQIVRAGEALAKLQQARAQLDEVGGKELLRGPGVHGKIAALQEKLGAYLPYSVSFQPQPHAVLAVTNNGSDAVAIDLGGRVVQVPAGQTTDLVVPANAVVSLPAGAPVTALLAEPHTRVAVDTQPAK